MQLDEVIVLLGSFGKFQRLQYLMACFSAICSAFSVVMLVYALYIPPHRCRVPSIGSEDYWGYNNSLVTQNVPQVACKDKTQEICYKNCELYANGTNSSVTGCTIGNVFNREDMDSTFATELNLVCSTQNDLTVTLMYQSHLVGVLVGALLTGWLSDKYGRKKVLLGCQILLAVAGTSSSLSSDIYSLWILRFIVGISSAGIFQTAFVLGMEFIGPRHRMHAGIIIEYAFSIGLMIMVGIAYAFRHWRWLNLVSHLVPLVSIAFYWLLQESPRWLISIDRIQEAEEIVHKAAKINQVELPQQLKLERLPGSKKETFFGMFRSRPLTFMTLNVFFQWFVIAKVYYGISLSSGVLPGNIYVNSLLNALAEAAGYVVPHISLNLIGRRKSHVMSMMLAAAALICTICVELIDSGDNMDWLLVLLTMIGKIGITSAFGVIYLWTAELFPTTVRQIGVGTASFSGRVGTLLAPFLADLSKFVQSSFGRALPQLIFGVMALLAGISAIFIPETNGIQLPETLDDGDMLARRRTRGVVEPLPPQTVHLDMVKQEVIIDS